MAISEQSRHQLFNRLEQVLGEEEARVLMEHLRPLGEDVATKHDVDLVRHDLQLLETRVEAKLERELRLQSGRFIAWLGVFLTIQTAVLATVTHIG